MLTLIKNYGRMLEAKVMKHDGGPIVIRAYVSGCHVGDRVCPLSAEEWAHAAARHFIATAYLPRYGNKADDALIQALKD